MEDMKHTYDMPMPMRHKMMMHMSFYWGKQGVILFDRWPGDNSGMYVVALAFVFVVAFAVEWLSHSRLIKPGSTRVMSGLIQTLMHAMRVSLGLLVMLSVMSFNVGVFLVAVAGHTLGFLIFGSRVFRKPDLQNGFDLPPLSC